MTSLARGPAPGRSRPAVLAVAALLAASVTGALVAALAAKASVARAQDAPPGDSSGDANTDMAMQSIDDMRSTDDEAARRHFLAGRSLYEAGSFEESARSFEEAYRLSQRPALLYNVYLSRRDAGNVRGAEEALRTYLEQIADAPDRVNLEARLRSLQETIAREDAAAQQQQAAEARARQLEARERERSAGSDRERSGPGLVPWIVAGGGAALVAAGVVTGILALGAQGRIDTECSADGLCYAHYDDLAADGSADETLGLVTDVMLFGGGAIAVAGLLWGLLAGGSSGEAEPPVSASCTGAGCAAALRLAF